MHAVIMPDLTATCRHVIGEARDMYRLAVVLVTARRAVVVVVR
jgi:hypothetical protein